MVPIEKERPVKKKTSTKDVDKPSTGYGLFFAEIVPTLKKSNPKLDFTEVSKMISRMWSEMDYKTKRDYMKTASRTGGGSERSGSSSKDPRDSSRDKEMSEEERLRLKRIKMKKIKARQAAEAEGKSPRRDSDSKQSDKRDKKRYVSDESPGPRVDHPKRNVKRKNFHVNISEELDSDDTDWEPKKLDPSLKFKKKGHDDDELPSVLGDSIPPPPSLKPQPKLDKPAPGNTSAPPPLKKQTPTSDLTETTESSHIKTKFRPICLKDGCYAHAAPSDARGQYWCSDPCCVTYCNQIFKAWVAARKANMIECA